MNERAHMNVFVQLDAPSTLDFHEAINARRIPDGNSSRIQNH
jgi:hypothetical protein